ncbi:MAG: hypothetical protein JWM53_5816 [bacterium]|jgi:hypothetical protein|nr:hypothetical protein [bacterium]
MGFERDRFREATDSQRTALCGELAVVISGRLREAAKFHDGVMRVVSELRTAGHDLWSLDEDDDFEVWGPNYATPTGPGIVITFRANAPSQVNWSTTPAAQKR